MSQSLREYPIKDYAIIGNCETAALVNPDGGIDWLCLPAFDSPSFFGALLDRCKGGSFSIRPAATYRVEREYERDSAILRTRFVTGQGCVELIDFFVIARRKKARFYDFVSLQPVRKLVRLVRNSSSESIPMEVRLEGRPDYGGSKAAWRKEGPGRYACDEARLYTDMPMHSGDGDLGCRFDLRKGEECHAVFDYGGEEVTRNPDTETLSRWLAVTRAFWREWNLFNYYSGPYQEIVRRSAVTLKLLTFAPSGAFVAAPTTSLPESPGRDQNWDYRYAWVRDTSLFITSLFRLGYSGEARAFFDFVRRQCAQEIKRRGTRAPGKDIPLLGVLYGIREESTVEERFLDHLAGYRNSRPVRTGNRAAGQFQVDNYGHLFEAVSGYLDSGGRMDAGMQEMMERFVTEVLERWQESDNGIWEIPERRHYTHGKIMAWLALRHACRFSCFAGRELEQQAAEIYDQVMAMGTARQGGKTYLAEAYGADSVDASCLLAYTVGFLSRDCAVTTREKVEEDLGEGAFLYRNPAKRYQEGEGAFLLCSFWLINHLIREGRLDKAEEHLQRVIAAASPLGLYAEEIDVAGGDFLGNFPQAFSHLGLITSILNLEEAKKSPGFHALTDSEKFKQSVGATIGWKGVFSGFYRVPQTLRLLFSTDSRWRED